MAKLDVKFFTNANSLQNIQITYLIEFILHFPEFCASHDINANNISNLTHSDIANAISESIKAKNKEEYEKLLNDLQNIKEMATSSNRSLLKKEVEKCGYKDASGRKLTDYDFSIYVWINYYAIFTTIHAKHRIKNYQSFLYFIGAHKKERSLPSTDIGIKEKIEASLNDWFEKNDRVPNAEVTFHIEQDILSIVIKYGMPLNRVTEYGDDKNEIGFCYNPIRYDRLIYNKKYDELSLNTPSLDEQADTYVKIFGKYLFDDENYFKEAKQFSLQKLHELHRPVNYACPGIRKSTLIEITYKRSDIEYEIRRGSDVMPGLIEKNKSYSAKEIRHPITAAKFKLFPSRKNAPARTLTIESGNKTKMDRGVDGLVIEEWIRKNQFLFEIINAKELSFWERLAYLQSNKFFLNKLRQVFTEHEIESFFECSVHEIECYPCDNDKSSCFREKRVIGDEIAFCCTDDKSCCLPINENDLTEYEEWFYQINMLAICKRILTDWNNSVKISDDIKVIDENNNLYRIGFYTPSGTIGYSIYFYVDVDEMSGNTILDIMGREGDKKFLILMPSTKFISQNNIDALRRQKSLILGLDRFACEDALQEFDMLNNIDDEASNVYNTPAGANWEDLTITFYARDQISIKFKGHKENHIIREENPCFCSQNTREKKPNIQWYFLMAFAIWGKPYIDMDDLKKFFGHDNWNKIKEQKSKLSKTLQGYFLIKEDPIKYHKKDKRYEPMLTIKQDINTDLKDWIEEVRLLCKA